MKYYGFKSVAKFPRSNLKNLGFAANGMAQVIKSLFANNEQGFAFDFNDLSTMYQDAAGTIPVTGVGQPVGRVLDKSGRGNHATQSTSAKRPILQKNATTGAYYLSFDGVDDYLTINNNLNINNFFISKTNYLNFSTRNLYINSLLQPGYLLNNTGQAAGGYPDAYDPNYYSCVSGEKFVGTSYSLNGVTSQGNAGYICFYDINKTFLSSQKWVEKDSFKSLYITAPANAAFYRYATIAKGIIAKLEYGNTTSIWSPTPEDCGIWLNSNTTTNNILANNLYSMIGINRQATEVETSNYKNIMSKLTGVTL